MNDITKSVLLQGSTNEPPTYVCYPANEFSRGNWKISICSLNYESDENISLTCKITCNFVTGQVRMKNGDIKIIEVWKRTHYFSLHIRPYSRA